MSDISIEDSEVAGKGFTVTISLALFNVGKLFIGKGRGQEAEGNSDSCQEARDRSRSVSKSWEQGFKTPTKFSIWWPQFRRGLNPLLN